MKKIFYLVMLTFLASAARSQDLDQINVLMGQLKYREAKGAIDKYLQDPKKAGESAPWYYKGRIYAALARDSSTPHAELFGLRNEAFEDFKKNQLLDPKDFYLKTELYASYLDLYFGFYEVGANDFNAQRFDAAFESFKKALEVKDYILSKKYEYTQATLYPLDTSLVLNAAASALNAKKTDIAMTYYKKIADAGISGKDYQDVYEYLVDYYSKKGDETALNAMLEKGRRLYPQDEFWADVELRPFANGTDKAALYAKYEELIAKDPGNFKLNYNYSIELYNSIYKDAKPIDDLASRNKLGEVLKRAIANEKPEGNTATILMANHLFNMAADLQNASNAIKSTKPDDVKKKNDFKAAASKAMDDCITYSESAVRFFEALPSRSSIQNANYRSMLDNIYQIYNLKNNKVKAEEYKKKMATVGN